MKTGRSRKYYLMEAVLILFNILINLIIFAVPLAVNQIINGKLALTDRVIAFIIGFMPVSYTHLDVYKRQAEQWSG